MPKMLGYCASKAGVNALMDGLRVELFRFDIGVTIVCPGYINTAMVAANEMPMPHLLEPGVASTRILWAIERRKAFHAFPWQLAWRLRLLKLLPRDWQDRIIRRWIAG